MPDPNSDYPAIDRRKFLYRAAGATAAVGLGGWWALQSSSAAAREEISDSLADYASRTGHGAHSGHVSIDRSQFSYAEGSREWATSHGGARGTVVRKSASKMSRQEIVRFKRAFEWAVAKGFIDVFNDEHYDHMRHRQHGADVLAGSPPAVAAGEGPEWGYRLLPWHRSFLIEAERMLRAALHDRCRRERRDPREANALFMPYWDATHDQRLPRWVERMRPSGGTAIVPPDLPEGHAGFGKPVGSRYRIEFGRWPGGWLVFDKLPPTGQFGRALAHDDFVSFYQAIDLLPELVTENGDAAKQALAGLAQKIPNDPNLQLILAFIQPDYPKDAKAQLDAFNAFLAIGHLASLEAVKAQPDQALIDLILTLYSAFRFPPHLMLHFWAGGLNPRNPNLRGTVSYFNELAVDPAFWMLHNEFDRIWYTWSTTHAEAPPLEDEDAVFQPIRRKEGAWYGGGRTYQLDQLIDLGGLPYRFDTLYQV